MVSNGAECDVLKDLENRRKWRKQQERDVDWYSWLIADHPYLVLLLCSCIISGCMCVSFLYVSPPDFSEPSKGFEVRGTPLSNRIIAWQNLVKETDGYESTISTYPKLYAENYQDPPRQKDKKINRGKRPRKKSITHEKKPKLRSKRLVPAYRWNFQRHGYFCHNPKSSYARMVMEPTDENAIPIWSTAGMVAICEIEKKLLSHPTYSDICTHTDSDTCCPTLSLPNYVAFLDGLESCENITDDSLLIVSNLLVKCSAYYFTGVLKSDCWGIGEEEVMRGNNFCKSVPFDCVQYNAVYSIYHYLMDSSSLKQLMKKNMSDDQSFHTEMKYTAVFLPALKGENMAQLYYDNFQSSDLNGNSVVKITGLDFGLRDTVFDNTLRTDKIYPAVAISLVVFIIVLYTESIFIPVMSTIASVSSLFIAYFFYSVIFEFSYFPFLNLTAIIVMIGIGADNALVYCSAWRTYKQEDNDKANLFVKRTKKQSRAHDNRLGVITKATLKHAARSMFVTGITTASAFLSNFASSVTAIKCFGVYTGLTVLANLFLCVTWLPASVVIHERNLLGFWNRIPVHFKVSKTKSSTIIKQLEGFSGVFFQKVQVFLVVKLRFFWLTLCMILAVCGCFIIFVNPKLRLPTSSTYFQYFRFSHPFETYKLSLSKNFAFDEKNFDYMPITVVFGVVPEDNGDPLDPGEHGYLVFNTRFNVSDQRSQIWMQEFCNRVRKQSFYRHENDTYLSLRMCFIEALKKWMSSIKCLKNGRDNRPCCMDTAFPYPPQVFLKCLKEAVIQLARYPGVQMDRLTPGPRFDKNDTLRAVIMEFPSTQRYTGAYDEVANFYNTVETWMDTELSTAPPGLRGNAWFVSDLEFYTLQHGLYQGTITAIGLSIGVVCIALIVTTCNVMITLLANITIAFTILVVVGTLVLMGWELNILESVTISIAIGLSVDFTVHYAVAYLLPPCMDRITRVENSLSSMGPAIALAALTTFLAGACMVPAEVTAYYKFGIFLMLTMTVSWFYSTYFFQALCCVLGPVDSCSELTHCFRKIVPKVRIKSKKRFDLKCEYFSSENKSSTSRTVIETSLDVDSS